MQNEITSVLEKYEYDASVEAFENSPMVQMLKRFLDNSIEK